MTAFAVRDENQSHHASFQANKSEMRKIVIYLFPSLNAAVSMHNWKGGELTTELNKPQENNYCWMEPIAEAELSIKN